MRAPRIIAGNAMVIGREVIGTAEVDEAIKKIMIIMEERRVGGQKDVAACGRSGSSGSSG